MTAKTKRHKRRRDPSKPQPGDSRPRRIWLPKLLALSVASVLALVAGEVIVRLLDVGPEIIPVYAENFRLSDNPELRYELVPGSQYLGGAINADGMRDRDYPVEKSAGVFRIACLGDSICFGYDVKADETIAGRLEEYLNRYYTSDGWSFEVLNFGVTGYNITQVVENLRLRALKYDPDLIIYAYSMNDPQEFSIELDALRAKLTCAEQNYIDRLRRPGRNLALHSRLYVLTHFILESRTSAGRRTGTSSTDREWSSLWSGTYHRYYSDLHQDADSWRRVDTGLMELGRITHNHGIPGYVVIFPVMKDFARYPLSDVHAKVAGAARDNSLLILDMLEPYHTLSQIPGERFARDYLHPDAPGYAYAAVVILRRLLIEHDLPVEDDDITRLVEHDTLEGHFADMLMRRLPLSATQSP